MLLKYESSDGTVITFNREPENRILKIGAALRNYKRDYKTTGKNIKYIDNGISEFELELSCMPAGDATADKEFIINTFEKDCITGKYGKLYIGQNFILCNIYAQNIEAESELKGIFRTKLKLITPFGWLSASSQEFYGSSSAGTADAEISDFPFDLHKSGIETGLLDNTTAIVSSSAVITFEALDDDEPLSGASVVIGSQEYAVNCPFAANQKIIIDPLFKTVKRVNKITGTEENVFKYRNTASNVFAPIEKGYHIVTVAEGVKATVQLIKERVTPSWI